MQRSSLVEEIVVDTVDDDVYAVRTCYIKLTNYLQRRRSFFVEEILLVEQLLYYSSSFRRGR